MLMTIDSDALLYIFLREIIVALSSAVSYLGGGGGGGVRTLCNHHMDHMTIPII